jgi:hypothetical protein
MTQSTIKNSQVRQVFAVTSAAIPGMSAVILLIVASSVGSAPAIALRLIAGTAVAVGSVGAYRSLRLRVMFDAAGVESRRTWTTDRITWGELDALVVAKCSPFGPMFGPPIRCLAVETNQQRIPLPATFNLDVGSDAAAEFLRIAAGRGRVDWAGIGELVLVTRPEIKTASGYSLAVTRSGRRWTVSTSRPEESPPVGVSRAEAFKTGGKILGARLERDLSSSGN